MPVKVANQMLNTEFARFTSSIRRDISVYRITKPYFLPSEIASYISVVDDIMRFPSIRQTPRIYGAQRGADEEFGACGSDCDGYTTPAVLQKAYSYSPMKSFTKGNSMSVAEFQYQYCKYR
jgi:hypothetical protein